MANPICPEPDCKNVLRLRYLTINLGLTGCPQCKISESKPYILTEKKKGMRKCLQCRKDYTPKRREGYGKYWMCKDHPWQKFKVGAEVIICKNKSKTEKEINDLLKPLMIEQARERRQQPQFRHS